MANTKEKPATDTIKVGGNHAPVEKSGVDEPGVSAEERKAETILASEARPLEQEIVSDPNAESEVQFLNRLMLIQREGGWGSHLTPTIMARIRKVTGVPEPQDKEREKKEVAK